MPALKIPSELLADSGDFLEQNIAQLNPRREDRWRCGHILQVVKTHMRVPDRTQ
jgi:hypothetical protein